MRLLALVTDAFGGRGGIAKFNRDLLEALVQLPACREIVALPRVVRDDAQAKRAPRGVSFRVESAGGKATYAWQVLKTVAQERFDGIICGHVNLSPLAAAVSLTTRAPLLQIVHGVEAWTPHASAGTRLALRSADAVVAVSDYTKQRFVEWSDVGADRVVVVPNCIDLSAFQPGAKPNDLLTRYALAGRSVILTLGRLEPNERYKGVDEVLEVLGEVAQVKPSVSYVIVGEGADRPRLEAKAASLGVGDRVCFTGYIDEAEKAAHYRLADAYVMPGWGEGFGIVYLEALACGIPVIASSRDASREAVRDGRLGAVVDPADRKALVAAILQALSGAGLPPGTRGELDYFSCDRFRQRWEKVVDDVFVTPAHVAHRRPLKPTQAIQPPRFH